MITPDLDVWRSAKLLVDPHVADVPAGAAQRADALLAAAASGRWASVNV